MGFYTDWTLPLQSTVLCGMSGSGKTGFAVRYLLNANAACRFIFDDTGQMTKRLGVPHCGTALEMEQAVSTRWVVYNPHRMFPGREKDAFLFFCTWAYEVSERGPGKKIFFADEIWRFVTPHVMPEPLAKICQMARAENVHLMTATQLPHKLHSSITGQCTEVVGFFSDEELALAQMKQMGLNPDEIKSLPLGKFISRNRLSRRTLSGRVF